MKANSPNGLEWDVVRKPATARPLAALFPGGRWVVEARTTDEVRRWKAPSRRAAGALVTEVARALRTGASGPSGEMASEARSRPTAAPEERPGA